MSKRPGPTSSTGGEAPSPRPIIMRGGKVDPEAIRLAARARAENANNPDAQRSPGAPGTPPDPPHPADPADPADPNERAGAPALGVDGDNDADAVLASDEDDDGLARVSFTLQRDLNKRLDKYLTDRISFMSRAQLQKLIDLGGVTVNGRPAKASTRLRVGDTVDVIVPPPPAKEIQPEPIPITVIYEDEQLLVLNKSPDIIVHPARSHNTGTLLNALVHYFQTTGQGGLSSVGKELARPGVVHRLDRKTSGVMVIAKDEEAHWKLGRQFEHRTTDKRYLALVEGVIETDADAIDAPIGPSPSRAKGQREKMAIRHDELGKPALTIFRVRERYHARSAGGVVNGYTLVELELKTGRTHQIRVHMSFYGYPLVGDDMYEGHALRAEALGRDAARAIAAERSQRGQDPSLILDRQALHAAMLGFRHPVTQQPVVFTAPLPPDLAEAVAVLRRWTHASGTITPPGATLDLAHIAPDAG
jgi:23S rRNA pseudouridine1911/1915/1917 synthase